MAATPSATSRVATAGVAPYAAVKGGLELLTRCRAREFGERGIRVSSIAPGPIRTEPGGMVASLLTKTAGSRPGTPKWPAAASSEEPTCSITSS
ncbi:SDR family oxidoreductase [Methylobrevis pamukkalensis]|uniref:SDR family oxidoreductase n=1 Tax=Methylobrevis pamukkalensis TaxID=1439726 RepID=UPI00114CE436|nr:SDR family oxidoreductase [Methylobrevis pamukkalensis]